jgi:hypothetical protein
MCPEHAYRGMLEAKKGIFSLGVFSILLWSSGNVDQKRESFLLPFFLAEIHQNLPL